MVSGHIKGKLAKIRMNKLKYIKDLRCKVVFEQASNYGGSSELIMSRRIELKRLG